MTDDTRILCKKCGTAVPTIDDAYAAGWGGAPCFCHTCWKNETSHDDVWMCVDCERRSLLAIIAAMVGR